MYLVNFTHVEAGDDTISILSQACCMHAFIESHDFVVKKVQDASLADTLQALTALVPTQDMLYFAYHACMCLKLPAGPHSRT